MKENDEEKKVSFCNKKSNKKKERERARETEIKTGEERRERGKKK